MTMKTYNGVTQFAPSPKRGNLKLVYEAMMDGPKSLYEIKLATNLDATKAKQAAKNGVHRGFFVKDPHRSRWAIAPKTVFDERHPVAKQKDAESHARAKKRREQQGGEVAKIANRLAKKFNTTPEDINRLLCFLKRGSGCLNPYLFCVLTNF